MEKVLIFKADRDLSEELDLRKKPLIKKDSYFVYKIIDGIPTKCQRFNYYYWDVVHSNIFGLSKDKFGLDINGKGMYYNLTIPNIKKKFEKYQKMFSSIDITNQDYSQILEKLDNLANENKELRKEIDRLISTCKVVPHKNKKGQYRRINYSNKLYIKGNGKINISDSQTNLIAGTSNNFSSYDNTFKIYKEPIKYYSMDDVTEDRLYGNKGKVYQLGIKKRKQIIELYSKKQQLTNQIVREGKEFIINLFN